MVAIECEEEEAERARLFANLMQQLQDLMQEIEEAVNNVPIDAEALPSKKSKNQMKREREKKRKKQMIGECLCPLIAKIVGLSLAG